MHCEEAIGCRTRCVHASRHGHGLCTRFRRREAAGICDWLAGQAVVNPCPGCARFECPTVRHGPDGCTPHGRPRQVGIRELNVPELRRVVGQWKAGPGPAFLPRPEHDGRDEHRLRAPLIFGYEPNRTWPTTLGRPGFVACRSDRQLMSTSRCVLHHVTTSVFSFQPVQANALKSLTQYEGRPEEHRGAWLCMPVTMACQPWWRFHASSPVAKQQF